MLFIFSAFLRQTFVGNRRGYLGIFATTYAERGGWHLALWNQSSLIAIKWWNHLCWRQFSSWYITTGVGKYYCWNCTHSWLNTVREELLQLRSEPYVLATSWSPRCLELEWLGGAAAGLKSRTHSIMQCKVFLLLLYSIMGSVDLASEGSEQFGPKTCFISFRWHPIKRTVAHFYSAGGPVWVDFLISSCRTFPYYEQVLGNQNRTRRLVIVSARWSPFSSCPSPPHLRLKAEQRRAERGQDC